MNSNWSIKHFETVHVPQDIKLYIAMYVIETNADSYSMFMFPWQRSGGRLNVKMPSYRYRESHHKDIPVSRPSHLVMGLSIPGVGVTKPISSVPLFSEIFSIAKTHVSYWISRLYLTGVAAAQLRWHLSKINVIQIIQEVLLTDQKFFLRRN